MWRKGDGGATTRGRSPELGKAKPGNEFLRAGLVTSRRAMSPRVSFSAFAATLLARGTGIYSRVSGCPVKYEFQLDPLGTLYRAIGGVYIFCRQTTTGFYSAAYVGETDSFLRRLSDELRSHHAIEAISRQGATHISTLHISGDRSNRLYVETDLRTALKPPCNQQ